MEHGDERRNVRENVGAAWRVVNGRGSSESLATPVRGGPGNRSCDSSGSSHYLCKDDLALRRERDENLTGREIKGVNFVNNNSKKSFPRGDGTSKEKTPEWKLWGRKIGQQQQQKERVCM
jgi:hypothetical protein